jgi:hypothetical protein
MVQNSILPVNLSTMFIDWYLSWSDIPYFGVFSDGNVRRAPKRRKGTQAKLCRLSIVPIFLLAQKRYQK